MPEVISKYQVTFNNFKIKQDAYKACKENKVCGATVDASDSEILNFLYRKAYKTIANTPMTNEEWDAATIVAESYSEISNDKESMEWFKLVNQFYSVILLEVSKDLKM